MATEAPSRPGREAGFSLSHSELLRYSRHLLLPEIGLEGQQRLKDSRVLLVGAGGLGSPAALYLTAAGIGTLGIVDFDAVDVTNLQRQIIHGTGAVGRPKLDSAAGRIADLNPHVRVEGHPFRLTSGNALEVIAGYDVVVDGSDNFPTRYLVNDACVLTGRPLVYGSIFRFDGQASVFDARRGPCYRCLYPEPPPPGLVPSCAEGGVLGVLPGIVGSIQALEAIKLITGAGEPLIGRLLLVDALRLRFRELALRKDPECPICGENPTVRALIDYDAFCSVGDPGPAPGATVSAAALADELRGHTPPLVVDVREPHELAIAAMSDARHIPLGELPGRLRELDAHRPIVTVCHRGVRSLRAAEILAAAGFRSVRSLEGGIDAWAAERDPEMARY